MSESKFAALAAEILNSDVPTTTTCPSCPACGLTSDPCPACGLTSDPGSPS